MMHRGISVWCEDRGGGRSAVGVGYWRSAVGWCWSLLKGRCCESLFFVRGCTDCIARSVPFARMQYLFFPGEETSPQMGRRVSCFSCFQGRLAFLFLLAESCRRGGCKQSNLTSRARKRQHSLPLWAFFRVHLSACCVFPRLPQRRPV